MRTLVAVMLLAAPAWAGVRMRAEMTDAKSGGVTTQTMMMDGSRVRVDMATPQGDTTMILLAEGPNPRMLIVNKAKNEYYEIDKQTMDEMQQKVSGAMAQMQEQMKNMPPEQRAMMEKMMAGKMGQMGQAQAPRPSTVYSAAGSATMNGFRCTRYNGTREGQKVAEVCAADPSQLNVSPADLQGFERLKEFSASMQKSASSIPMNQPGADFADPGIQGFPVHQSTFRDGQLASKFDLKELQKASFTDADFSPGAARKISMMPEGRPRR